MLTNGLQMAAQTGSSDGPPKETLFRDCRDAQAYRWMHRRGQRNTVSGMPSCNARGCGCKTGKAVRVSARTNVFVSVRNVV
jgi:hypothetical protein